MSLSRALAVCLVLANTLIVAHGIVPAYLGAQSGAILASAERHGVPPSWLAAVLYNEMLGTEDAVLRSVLPGDDAPHRTARSIILGLHFMSLKQAQWQAKSVFAMSGANPTLGPTGIRVTVGREIHAETKVGSGLYSADGLLERPSLIADLSNPASAIEYLAANLERGQQRLALEDRGDWEASARWHNTGVVYDSAIVLPEDWAKGSRYIARVHSSLPMVEALLGTSLEGSATEFAGAKPGPASGLTGTASLAGPASPIP